MTKAIQKTICMPCHPKFLDEARGVLTEVLNEIPLPNKEKELLTLGIEEAVTSIVAYASQQGTENEISLTLDIDDVRFKATIIDSLNVFDLNDALTEHQLLARADSERAHKLGIFLIRQAMDEITYTYKKGFENQLEMVKFL